MKEQESRYFKRGVSFSKSDVHKAIKGIDKGLYPNAFCKILPDITGGSEEYCNLMHADTAGTKTSLAYLYWRETGDLDVWKGIVQDSIVMNLDDMACVGCIQDIILSSTVGRNKHKIPGEVISTIINSAYEFIGLMNDYGVNLFHAGGETADVGDIVRTIDVGYTAFARMKRNDLIVNDIKAGDHIVGFSSSGQTTYESQYNGGMGSNGLTSARHDVLDKKYADRYPESYDQATESDLVYSGSKDLTQKVEINGNAITIGKLILSPTRTYLPVLLPIINNFKSSINGMIHCTGGAQTKVLHFVQDNLHIVKDNLLELPPLFKLIKEESGAAYKEMYSVFNMGHRLEIYCSSLDDAHQMIDLAKDFNLDAQIIGRVEESEKTKLTIHSPEGPLEYFK